MTPQGPGTSPPTVVFFPAAGSGGETEAATERAATRFGFHFAGLPNPKDVGQLVSGDWLHETLLALPPCDEGDRFILVGHCMGGFSALLLAKALSSGGPRTQASVVMINTPLPGPEGAIPTMTGLKDSEIASYLRADGFPEDLLEDEDVLEEIADGLRAEAAVGDALAREVSKLTAQFDVTSMATRGDTFIPPSASDGWWSRVRGTFRSLVCDGNHGVDEKTEALLSECIEAHDTTPGKSREMAAQGVSPR